MNGFCFSKRKRRNKKIKFKHENSVPFLWKYSYSKQSVKVRETYYVSNFGQHA